MVLGALAVMAAPGPASPQSVTVVQNNPEAPVWKAGKGWGVSNAPVISIGRLDGAEPYVLFRVVWGGRRSDGRIVVLNGGTNEFRVFDPTGTFLYSFGGVGDGPGELRRPEAVALLEGDSLLVQDGFRISVFAPDGTFARSFGVIGTRPLPPQLLGRLGQSLVFRDGDIATRTLRAGSDGRITTTGLTAGLDQGRYAFVRYNMTGEFIDSIGVFRGSDMWITIEGTRQTYTSVPFGRAQETGVAPALLVTGWSETFGLDVYDAHGRANRRVELETRADRVTEADFWSGFEARFGNMPLQQRRATEARYAAMPKYPTLPAFGRIKVDPLGYIWVEAQSRRDVRGAGSWWVFNSAGRLQGAVQMPDVSILDIGADYVLARALDEYDVETVVLYGLRRTVGK